MFPNQITIKIINTEHNPIHNIAIRMKIFAKHKNNYYLIPSVSNINGLIKVSQKWIRESIEKDRNLFIMDYASTLDDCHSKIEIKVMSKEEVDSAIRAKKLYKEETSDEEVEDLEKNVNYKYIPALKIIEIYETEEQIIEIVLENM